jgi:uncharacterized protein (TIGR02611 family)
MSDTPRDRDSQPDDHHNRRQERREALHDFYESALEAEKQTGRHESDDKEARRSLFIRIITIFLGAVVTLLGFMMLVLPGPGLLVVAIGLGILARDVPFAQRWLKVVRDRLPQDESGQLTKGTIVTMIVVATLGIGLSALSLWWTFWRG